LDNSEGKENKKEKNVLPLQHIINERREVSYDEVERTADAIEAGTAHIDRLSLAEEQGRREGGRRNVEASVILGAKESADSKKGRNESGRENGRGSVEEQEQRLKEYAQKEGIWISPEEIEKWDYMSSGMEARVYEDENPEYVRKVYYNYKNFSEDVQEFLDNRISLHNYIFGDSGTIYELIGFTETYGVTRDVPGRFFAPVVRQRHIKGRELKKSELPLLDAEMERRGFDKINGVYVSRDYVIDDLHADNVMIAGDGNFHFIDTVPSLNTAEDDFEGEREYGSGEVRTEEGGR
jgi:hypothetical protein